MFQKVGAYANTKENRKTQAHSSADSRDSSDSDDANENYAIILFWNKFHQLKNTLFITYQYRARNSSSHIKGGDYCTNWLSKLVVSQLVCCGSCVTSLFVVAAVSLGVAAVSLFVTALSPETVVSPACLL